MKNKLVAILVITISLLVAACGDTSSVSTEVSTETASTSSQVSETSTESVTQPEDREEEFSVDENLANVTLGKYEQDNNAQNGTEAIEWIVLETKDNTALVISKYVLDCQPFNKGFAECTWETSTVRKWLNSDFYNAAFSESEQARILTTFVTDVNPELTPEGDSSTGETDEGEGENEETSEEVTEEQAPEVTGTEDKIFLLSDFELTKYLADDENIDGDEAYAKVTAYAEASGVWTMTESLYNTRKDENSNPASIGCGWYWLRTSGENQTKALDVDSSGNIRKNGHDVGEGHDGVRPAMWITLD